MYHDLKFDQWHMFSHLLSGQGYINCTASWQEQRQFLDLALNSLGSHPVVPSIMSEFENLEPSIPDLTGLSLLVSLNKKLLCFIQKTSIPHESEGRGRNLGSAFHMSCVDTSKTTYLHFPDSHKGI